MMLKSVPARVLVGVSSKIGQDKKGGIAGVFGLALNRLPKFRTEAIRTSDGIDVERVGPGVRDIDIVHRDPQKTWRFLLHQALRDVHGEFVRARQRPRMSHEVIDRKLQDRLQLLQLEFTASNLRRVERSFVVVTQQVFVVRSGARTMAALSRCFGRTTLRPQAGTIRATFALANPVESVAGCDDPCIRERPLQVFAEVLEDRGMFRAALRKSY